MALKIAAGLLMSVMRLCFGWLNIDWQVPKKNSHPKHQRQAPHLSHGLFPKHATTAIENYSGDGLPILRVFLDNEGCETCLHK